MKLYNANLSPFAARCRIQIYATRRRGRRASRVRAMGRAGDEA
jgi:hypothetical protein